MKKNALAFNTTKVDRERTRALKSLRDEQREVLVRHYTTNLLDFARDVISYNEPNNMILDHVHGPLCRLLEGNYYGTLELKVPEKSIRGVLINVPRGCFKSTICTIAYPIWILLQNRPLLPEDGWEPPKSFNGKKGYNQRINIAHETDDESEKYLGAIAHHLHKNELLRMLWGDNVFWKKKTEGRWSAYELDIPWRDDYTAREANVSTSSLRSSIAGGHYDVTVWDDLFTEKTTNEESGIDRIMGYYQKYVPVAHTPSLLNVIGTRKHDADLYGYIQEKEAHKWHILVEKAWRGPDEIANGKREFFFEEKIDRDYLLDAKERMGIEAWSSEFQNEPVNPDSAAFKEEWFTFFELDELDKTGMLFYTLSDPAIADQKKSCLATVVTVGVNPKGHFYIVDAWGEKGVGDDPEKYIDELFRQAKAWDSLWTAVETVGFQRMIKWMAEQRAQREGLHLNFFELKPGGRSKEARILGLRPLARQGGIRLQKHHHHLLTEFLRYPRGRSRDFIDTIAYTPDVAMIPDEEKPVDKTPEVKKGWKEQMALQRMAAMGIVFPGSDLPSNDDRFDIYQ